METTLHQAFQNSEDFEECSQNSPENGNYALHKNCELHIPSLNKIDQELSKIINQQVINHLQKIIKSLSNDYSLNYERLKAEYLDPITEVAQELSKK